ncbi:MAG: Zn-dependent alcohol dehydrogenase [Paracoccaceae bacterium]|nr:Zn-dependent alcohol dehydrogenase [Paracoccaceae bacterium]
MRAAICREFGKPLEIAEVTLADPDPGEVRAEVRAVAICHSDVLYASGGWGGQLPAVYGHEAAGVVTKVGEGVTDFTPGDHVVITLVRNCGTCPCCARNYRGSCESSFPLDDPGPLAFPDGNPVKQGLRTAAFAEEVTVHQSQMVAIPRDVPFDAASLLACGVITGWGAVINTAAPLPGRDLVVIGCGGVGLNAVQGAAQTNPKRLIAVDLSAEKLAAAEAFGATHTVDGSAQNPVQAVRDLTGGRGADYIFVTVGAVPAMKQSYAMMAPGGCSVLVGMADEAARSTFNPLALSDNSGRIIGSKMGHSDIRADIPRLVEMYRAGDLMLDELITVRLPFDQINQAIENVEKGIGLRNVIVME